MVVVTRKSEGVEEEEWDERRHLSPARPVTSLVVLDWAGGACGKRPTDTVTGERQRASVRAGGDRGGVEGPGQPVAGGPWTPPGVDQTPPKAHLRERWHRRQRQQVEGTTKYLHLDGPKTSVEQPPSTPSAHQRSYQASRTVCISGPRSQQSSAGGSEPSRAQPSPACQRRRVRAWKWMDERRWAWRMGFPCLGGEWDEGAGSHWAEQPWEGRSRALDGPAAARAGGR